MESGGEAGDPRHQREAVSENPSGESAPTPVGEYAQQLKRQLRALPEATITGEVTSLSQSRVQLYFELRDERGGVQGTMWKREFEALGLPEGAIKVGAQIVATGSPDYYEGGRNASPSFSFRATDIRLSGEGDLIARLARLRRQFEAEGLTLPQKQLRLPDLPRRIGVITAEGGAARQDLMAGLERRGWRGEIVWGFAPVQDRKAAPLITRTLGDMAAFGGVDMIVVCRGGGSLTDLWAFCDEDLCRTVAMLATPVVSAVGHERDVTLIDDVAAVRASTPTHAAEAAVRIDVNKARSELEGIVERTVRAGRVAVRERVGPLGELAKGPGRAIRAERVRLNQTTREIRASAERGFDLRRQRVIGGLQGGLLPATSRAGRLIESSRGTNASRPLELTRRVRIRVDSAERKLAGERVALRAHDPQRTLERGYARVEGRSGEPVVDAKSAREAEVVKIHFADDAVNATIGVSRRRRPRQNDPENGEFEQIRMEGLEDDE